MHKFLLMQKIFLQKLNGDLIENHPMEIKDGYEDKEKGPYFKQSDSVDFKFAIL